jgi:hypothetical protein
VYYRNQPQFISPQMDPPWVVTCDTNEKWKHLIDFSVITNGTNHFHKKVEITDYLDLFVSMSLNVQNVVKLRGVITKTLNHQFDTNEKWKQKVI